ncbi:MAG: radical SAM protein [Actinomycetota bacterium]|nr:radical SAM protein [Actinomycetota bacterium]
MNGEKEIRSGFASIFAISFERVNMRVLFVHYEEDYVSREKPLLAHERVPFGISYISSVLKKAGHETEVVMPTVENVEVVEERVRDYNPGLVCFTSVYSTFKFLSQIAQRIKRRYPDVFLALGGTHPSLDPEECLKSPFDIVCVGEGEYPTLELVEQIERGGFPGGIANLYIKNKNHIERNSPRPFISNLDSLPFPDREVWLPLLAAPLSRPSILAGRGCPFSCAYCCNHALRKVSDGKYVRLRSPENIVAEIMWFKSILPLLEDIYIEVETLGANAKWAFELCDALESMNKKYDVQVAFGCNLRITPGMDFERLFDALRRANFYFVNIGIESGSERIRRDVLKRYYSNEDVVRAIETARKYDLKVGTYNMIGIPGERKEDFNETIKLHRKVKPNWFMLSVFFPYPGTRLFEECKEMGLLDGVDMELERRRAALELPGFSKRQIKRRFNWSPALFNIGLIPFRRVLHQLFLCRLNTSNRFLALRRKVKRFTRILSGGIRKYIPSSQ